MIPKEIGNLQNLRMLYLSCNQLEFLPPEIGNIKSLKDFSFPYNNLTVLPAEIGLLDLNSFVFFNNKLVPVVQEYRGKRMMRYLRQIYYLRVAAKENIFLGNSLIERLTCNYFLQDDNFNLLPVDIINLKKLLTQVIVELFLREEENARTATEEKAEK